VVSSQNAPRRRASARTVGESTGTLRRSMRGHPHRRRSSKTANRIHAHAAALHPLLPTRNAVLRHSAALDRQILRLRDRGADHQHGADHNSGLFGSASSAEMLLASVRDELDEKLVDNMPAGLEAIPAGGRRVGSERARLWPGSFSVRPMPSVWSSCGDSGLRRRPLDSGLALPVSPAHKLGRKRQKRVEKVE
jgi:hypothetical protein